MKTETYGCEQWEAGGEPKTVTGDYAAGLTIPARTPLGQVKASGEFVAWDPAANDGSEVAVRMTVIDIDTAAGAKKGPMYSEGIFNSELINWPSGVTEAQKRGAFVGTNLGHQTLRSA